MTPDRPETVPADAAAGIEVTTTAARGAASLTAAHGALMVAGYVVAVVLARELGPAAYGVYGLVYSVLLGVELIGRLGVPQAVSRLIAERADRAPRLEATGTTLTLAIYLPLFLVFWFGAPLLADLFRIQEGAALFRIAAIDIPFFGLYFVASHILGGRRSFGEEAIGVSIYAAARVVGILILVLVGVTIEGALIVNAAASVVGLAFVGWRVGGASFRVTLVHGRPLIRLAIPIGLFVIGTQVLVNVDLWSLNALGTEIGDQEKGFYVAATNLARLANVVGFVMAGVLVPTIARARADGDVETVGRSARGAGRFLAVMLLPATAVAIAEAPGILTLVFSDQYRSGASLLALLVVAHGLFFTVFVSLCGILIGISRERDAATIALASVPIALLANVILIDAFGASGAAMAAMTTTAAATAASAVRVRRWVGSVLAASDAVRILLVSVSVWALARTIPTEGVLLLLELVMLVVLYLAVLWAIRVIGPDDVALFHGRGSGASGEGRSSRNAGDAE
jgi:O-antigen/teichoic acid export membrane protein